MCANSSQKTVSFTRLVEPMDDETFSRLKGCNRVKDLSGLRKPILFVLSLTQAGASDQKGEDFSVAAKLC